MVDMASYKPRPWSFKILTSRDGNNFFSFSGQYRPNPRFIFNTKATSNTGKYFSLNGKTVEWNIASDVYIQNNGMK